MSLKSRWVTLWLWGRQGFYGKTNHFTRLLGALGRSEQALRNRNSSRHNLKQLSAFLITTFLTLQGRFLAELLPHLRQPCCGSEQPGGCSRRGEPREQEMDNAGMTRVFPGSGTHRKARLSQESPVALPCCYLQDFF